MTPHWIPGFLIALFAAIALAIPAVAFLRRGFRPRRVGTTPHCAKCNYNLTGLNSERCPECGANLLAGNVVYGERTRARIKLLLGMAFLLPALFLLVLALYSVNWYQIRPTGWLISDLSSTGSGVSQQAWTELTRRDQAGSLSNAQRTSLIDRCLKEQAATTSGSLTSSMMDYLGQCLLKGRLTAAQQKSFFTQAVTINMVIRPTVILGDPVTYEVQHRGRGPSSPFWTQLTQPRVILDGQTVREGDSGYSGWSGVGAGGSSGSSIQVKTVGHHKLTIENHVAVHEGGVDASNPRKNLIYEWDMPATAEFEILPAAPAGYIKRNADPALAPALQAAIQPADFKFRPGTEPNLDFSFKIDKVPASIAFEVFLRIDGREYPAGSIHKVRGESTHWGLNKRWSGNEAATAPQTINSCDVILRGNEGVARNTVDLFEFWDGELVYKDVPVNLKTPATQTTPAAEQ